MNISKRTIAGVGATGVLLLGAAYPAFAQDATEEPTATEEETTTDRETGVSERSEELAAALAEELGLDTETVAAALEAVQTQLAEEREAEHRAEMEERLAEVVADGSLTQEQADALLAAQESGVLGGPGFGNRGGHGGPGFDGPGFDGPGFDGPGFGGPDFGGPGGFGPEDAPDADETDEGATGSSGSASEEAATAA